MTPALEKVLDAPGHDFAYGGAAFRRSRRDPDAAIKVPLSRAEIVDALPGGTFLRTLRSPRGGTYMCAPDSSRDLRRSLNAIRSSRIRTRPLLPRRGPHHVRVLTSGRPRSPLALGVPQA